MVMGRALLVETTSAHALAWAALMSGKPALGILPPEGGVHPVMPAREAVH